MTQQATSPSPSPTTTTTTTTTTTGLNIDLIDKNIFKKFETAEAAMVTKVSTMAADPTMGEMVKLQMETQKWTVFGELTTTLCKACSDFSKKCIQQSS